MRTVVEIAVKPGRLGEAQAMVASISSQFDGSADLQMLAGDISLLQGDSAGAMTQYRQVATIRANWPLVRRMVAIQSASGDAAGARRTLAQHLRANPREAAAAALLGRMQRDAGNGARATLLLRHAAAIGSGPSDPLLLSDLAELELAAGRGEDALRHARQAQALAPAIHRVAAVLRRLQRQPVGD